MTEAERIVQDLEVRRSRLWARARVLDDQRAAHAYNVVINSSLTARVLLRSLDEEISRIADEVELLNLAIGEATKRATQRDCDVVMRELMEGTNEMGETGEKK